MNQVERWFGLLTDKLIRRGVHTSVQALENDIKDWIATWNTNPRPVHLDQDRRRDLELPRRLPRQTRHRPPSKHGRTNQQNFRHDTLAVVC
jgi:hypothetical protein